jgi:hypothetical protein
VIGEQLKDHVALRYDPLGLSATIEASLDGAQVHGSPPATMAN